MNQSQVRRTSDARRKQLTQAIKDAASRMRAKERYAAKLRSAVQCGRALLQLRQLIQRGSWNRWVVEHCRLNRMTANRYIRLAGRTHLIARTMTLREAYIAAGVIPCAGGGRKGPAVS